MDIAARFVQRLHRAAIHAAQVGKFAASQELRDLIAAPTFRRARASDRTASPLRRGLRPEPVEIREALFDLVATEATRKAMKFYRLREQTNKPPAGDRTADRTD